MRMFRTDQPGSSTEVYSFTELTDANSLVSLMKKKQKYSCRRRLSTLQTPR